MASVEVALNERYLEVAVREEETEGKERRKGRKIGQGAGREGCVAGRQSAQKIT